MIQAATAKMKQKSRSGAMILMGVICAGASAAGKERLMIIRATVDIAITIAMKISRRHPARKPFGPMKIRLVVESAGGVSEDHVVLSFLELSLMPKTRTTTSPTASLSFGSALNGCPQ